MKTQKTHKAGNLMAVIDNKISDTEKVVAFETCKNDRWIAYLRDLNVQTHNRNQSAKQFSFHNCTVTIL